MCYLNYFTHLIAPGGLNRGIVESVRPWRRGNGTLGIAASAILEGSSLRGDIALIYPDLGLLLFWVSISSQLGVLGLR